MNVLIVDDSKTVLRINAQICSTLGFDEIYTAENGEEALQHIDKEIALILLDVNMPVMNGFEFLEKTQKIRKEKNIKTFMCTTEGGKEEVVKALKLGANNYIVKPIKRDVLEEKIKAIME